MVGKDMSIYLYAIIDVLYNYFFELFWLSIGLILLAFMDFINFQRPKDSGYFSLHTKGNRNDAWHHSKRLAILSFAIAAIGEQQIILLIDNPYIWVGVLAYIWQLVYHLLKFMYNLIRRK